MGTAEGGGLTSLFNRKERVVGGREGVEKEMGGFRGTAAITGRLQWSEG